jgi:hypothetical protein
MLTETQLNNKILHFLTRKAEEFPEVFEQKSGINASINRKKQQIIYM